MLGLVWYQARKHFGSIDYVIGINCYSLLGCCILGKSLQYINVFFFFFVLPTGVIVENTRMDLGSSVEINEGVNEIEFDVTISSLGGGADARGEGLWKMKTFTTTDYTGKSGRNLLDEQSLTTQQAGQDMMSGSRTTFRNLAATINKEQVSCADDTYLCVELSRGDRPSKDFSMNPAYEDSYLSCERLKCAKRNEPERKKIIWKLIKHVNTRVLLNCFKLMFWKV